MRRGIVLALAAAGILAGILWIGPAVAQERRREGPPERSPEEMRQRIEQFRQQMSDRLRETLKASEEDWKILGPRIEKVQTLSRQTRGGFGGAMIGGRGPGGRGGPTTRPEGEERPQSDVEKKTEELRVLLQDETAQPAQIKAALTALRDARARVREELEVAQRELREVVTLLQEAQLVLMGILD